MQFSARTLVLCTLMALVPLAAAAQGAQVAFGGLKHDASLPVEVSADQLNVNQADGSATFSGHVVVGQGDLRLAADEIRVEYASGQDATGKIEKLHARGNVVLKTGAEAAEAQEAVYSIASAQIVMTGGVILTQGQNALSGQRLVVDLRAGTGSMEGRVQTIFQTGGSNP